MKRKAAGVVPTLLLESTLFKTSPVPAALFLLVTTWFCGINTTVYRVGAHFFGGTPCVAQPYGWSRA